MSLKLAPCTRRAARSRASTIYSTFSLLRAPARKITIRTAGAAAPALRAFQRIGSGAAAAAQRNMPVVRRTARSITCRPTVSLWCVQGVTTGKCCQFFHIFCHVWPRNARFGGFPLSFFRWFFPLLMPIFYALSISFPTFKINPNTHYSAEISFRWQHR